MNTKKIISNICVPLLFSGSFLGAMEKVTPTYPQELQRTQFVFENLPLDIRRYLLPFIASGDIPTAARSILALAATNKALRAFLNNPDNMLIVLQSLPYPAHAIDLAIGEGRRSYGSTNRPKLAKMPVIKNKKIRDWIEKQQNELVMGEELVNAATNHNLETVELLLKNPKIDLNYQWGFGFTALMEAVRSRPKGRIDNSIAIMKLLLDAQANPDLQNFSSGNTALIQAANRWWRPERTVLLLEKGADIHLLNKDNETAYDCLYSQCQKSPYRKSDNEVNDIHQLLFLLEPLKSAAVNERGQAALCWAIENGHIKTASQLIERVVRPAQYTFNLRTEDKKSYFHLIQDVEVLNLTAKYLLGYYVNCTYVNCKDVTGNTPLHIAAQNGHADFVRLLLESGADKTIKNNFGKTALDIAKEKSYQAIIDLLQSKSAESQSEQK